MSMVGNVTNLHKQGKCKYCGIALYSYNNERRYVCGGCEPKHDMTGQFARQINDYVPYIPEISDERALILLENQIDDLKREVLFWKAKANDR